MGMGMLEDPFLPGRLRLELTGLLHELTTRPLIITLLFPPHIGSR